MLLLLHQSQKGMDIGTNCNSPSCSHVNFKPILSSFGSNISKTVLSGSHINRVYTVSCGFHVIFYIVVDVLLKATGDAPIMKKKKWAVDKNKPVSYLCDFIKKFIKCEPSESLVSFSRACFFNI